MSDAAAGPSHDARDAEAPSPSWLAQARPRREEDLFVHAVVARSYGPKVTHIAKRIDGRDGRSHRSRRYSVYNFIGPFYSKSVFVKTIRRSQYQSYLDSFEKFINLVPPVIFETPEFLGMESLGRARKSIGIWEFLPKRPIRRWFKNQSSLESVVDAAAAIAGLTESARQAIPGLPARIGFIRPTAERLADLMEEEHFWGLEPRECETRLSRLAKLEDSAIKRLDAGAGYLAHNDLRPDNFSVEPGKATKIYDWESVSFGPIGASLRFTSVLPQDRLKSVVDHYCEQLKQYDIDADTESVMYNISAVHLFRNLTLAGYRSDKDWKTGERSMRWALDNIDRLAT